MHPCIRVFIVHDIGAACKCIPTYERLSTEDTILYVDDDRYYSPTLFYELWTASQDGTVAACASAWPFSYVTRNASDDCLLLPLGCNGVLVPRDALRDHNIEMHISKCEALLYADDLFLAALLHHNITKITCIHFADQKRLPNNSIQPLCRMNRNQTYETAKQYLTKAFPCKADRSGT